MPKSRIERIAECAPKRAVGLGHAALRHFLSHYYSRVSTEDLAERKSEDLAGAAVAHLQMAQRWSRGPRRLEIFNPSVKTNGFESRHTIIQIVTRDSPFLVDSVSTVLNQLGFTVHLIVHPVYCVRRDAEGVLKSALGEGDDHIGRYESFMHIEIDRETDAEQLKAIKNALDHALENVRVAVEDWRAMVEAVRNAIDNLYRRPPPFPSEDISEVGAFLDWLIDDNFTLLGYREYRAGRHKGETVLRVVSGTGLGILRGPRMPDGSRQPTEQPLMACGPSVQPPLLTCTKSSYLSTVHRPGYMDRISLLRYDRNGKISGEYRIIGLFSSDTYLRNPREIPLLRRKIEDVRNRSGLGRSSHAGKALLNILDTFPRDELLQANEDELFETVVGILHLQERQRVRLFMRTDPYGRFVTCLLFVPRDRFHTDVRKRIEALLNDALNAKRIDYTISLSEAALARLYFVVHVSTETKPSYEVKALEKQVESVVRSWSDRLRSVLEAHYGEEVGRDLHCRYSDSFPAGYEEDHDAAEALEDIECLELTAQERRLVTRLYHRDPNKSDLNLKLFHPGSALPLSKVLPMLENLGVFVWTETPYDVALPKGPTTWIHDFVMRPREGDPLDASELAKRFQDAVDCVWEGRLENDELNQLVLRAGLSAQQVVMLRAYTKYMRQIGVAFSQRYMAETLAKHGPITTQLVSLFELRFKPRVSKRNSRTSMLAADIVTALDAVASLDEDRILRRYFNLIQATLRSSYFQTDAEGQAKAYLALKLDPDLLGDLPLPHPRFEIFVYSPRVEGVHLRGGEVARGGLRWSDRREDFRTEVLGLMKAQMVKNAVIVPVGAKGGFFVKEPPADRAARLEEGIACYQTFVRGLLDLTDNRIGGKMVPPPSVVRYDDDDPYLVVAADKGTASFSDIANAISAEYRFWLGDAFASGGSVGYDHKAMGITARGAWESVRHHFQLLGVDERTQPFTVIGIGDMSGDVFGNGMLLSQQIRLLGAFDHRHIFIDPEPDAAASFAERKRLFELAGSSWDDFNRKCLSQGGGVYPRSLKSISLSPQAREALGIKAERMTPDQLIQAMLRAPVDLLWNGGIGTYVKANFESHADVGDKANDTVRTDSRDLRCKLFAEGGNLGITQCARIQFSAAGGLINADWIDNAGGVHCSDLEVNIKILLNKMVAERKLTKPARDRLLRQMTDEVASRVLASNYRQVRSLTLAEQDSRSRIGRYMRLIEELERAGGLSRQLEQVPDNQTLIKRRKDGLGLRRPELAVVIAYTKNLLYSTLLVSSFPDSTYLDDALIRYFPKQLKRFSADVRQHELRREIVSTVVSNSMVNRAGITFAHRLAQESGRPIADVAKAYMIARDSFSLAKLWDAIDALDFQVDYALQEELVFGLLALLDQASRWLLRHRPQIDDIGALIDQFKSSAGRLEQLLPNVLVDSDQSDITSQSEQWTERGVPAELAGAIARLPYLAAVLDICTLVSSEGWSLETTAAIYFNLGERLRFSRLHRFVDQLPAEDRWQDRARVELDLELDSLQALATRNALRAANRGAGVDDAVKSWLTPLKDAYAH
jgi:glutamate dehydrogenase